MLGLLASAALAQTIPNPIKNNDHQSIGFTGYQKDETTGLYYANARFYDPYVGEFISMDPAVGDPRRPLTLNKYLYANANPLVYIDPTGKYGIFFDGTGNDNKKSTLAEGRQSNVYRLSEIYEGPTNYQIGVGTNFFTSVVGGITGWGARRRIEKAYKALDKFYNSKDAREMRANNPEQWEKVRQIDVFGFSRGSAEAREFVHVLQERGIVDKQTRQKFADVDVRFLGVFDTVASMGVPGNNTNIGYHDRVDPEFVRNTRHAIAADEFRSAFSVTSLRESVDAELPQNQLERIFRGAHSDIGDGYGPKHQGKPNSLARIPLGWMQQEAIRSGVPLPELSGATADQPDIGQLTEAELEDKLIHDSREGPTGFTEKWKDRQERTFFYGNGTSQTFTREELAAKALERTADSGKELISSEAGDTLGHGPAFEPSGVSHE